MRFLFSPWELVWARILGHLKRYHTYTKICHPQTKAQGHLMVQVWRWFRSPRTLRAIFLIWTVARLDAISYNRLHDFWGFATLARTLSFIDCTQASMIEIDIWTTLTTRDIWRIDWSHRLYVELLRCRWWNNVCILIIRWQCRWWGLGLWTSLIAA